MQGLVVELPLVGEPKNALLFGPPPKTKDDMKYLIEVRGVSCIVNLCPFTNERTKNGTEKAERYMEYCKVDEEHPERTLNVGFVRQCLDVASFEPTGRNKDLKKESWGQFYANHAKMVDKIEGNIYIHCTTGADEEAYIAFAVWRLRNPSAKMDFLAWIREKDYEWVFNDDVDKKELLSFVLSQVQKEHRKTSFFKKAKKDDD